MRSQIETFENYPFWIVLTSNVFSLSIYLLGSLIMLRLGWLYTTIYLIYALFLEIKLIKKHCINCFYWGKTCAFGKGKISSWFFKKGDISRFCAIEFTWKNMIPDLLVFLIPLIVGIVLLIIKFNIFLLVSLAILILFSTFGNGFVRGNLACKFCKQRELGCKAEELFNKNKRN